MSKRTKKWAMADEVAGEVLRRLGPFAAKHWSNRICDMVRAALREGKLLPGCTMAIQCQGAVVRVSKDWPLSGAVILDRKRAGEPIERVWLWLNEVSRTWTIGTKQPPRHRRRIDAGARRVGAA